MIADLTEKNPRGVYFYDLMMNYVVKMFPVWVCRIEQIHLWHQVNHLQAVFAVASRINLVGEVSFIPEQERNVDML